MPTNYSGNDTFPSAFQVPSDGDKRTAASVNVGLEALGDRTQYLYTRRLDPTKVFVYTVSNSNDGFVPTIDVFNTSSYVQSTNTKIDVPGCAVGDRLLIDLSCQSLSVSATSGSVRIYVTQNLSGTPVTSHLDTAKKFIDGGSGTVADCAISGVNFLITTAGTARVGVEGIRTAGSGGVDLVGALSLRAVLIKVV